MALFIYPRFLPAQSGLKYIFLLCRNTLQEGVNNVNVLCIRCGSLQTEATLSCTMVKAVHAVCNCMVGTGEGAVGTIDHRTVAEYKSSAGPDMYHLVVFDSGSGNIMASIYDNNTETIENYKLHQSSQDGAAVMMAMMPLLLKDDEFDENFQTYFDQRSAGYPDMKKATDAMAILCDNAYRRIKDDTCPAHIKVTLDKSGNVLRVSQGHLLSGVYTPTSVLAGEFTILAKTGKATVSAAKAAIDHRDFVGKYQLTGGRKLSILEESLVPKLIDWINSTEITGDPYRSALCTIISKATSDPEDRETLKTAILEPIFAPKRRRTA